MGLAATTHFFLDDQSWPQPVVARLAPDAILTQTNATGTVADIDEDPDSPDAAWVTGAGDLVLRVSFPTPSGPVLANFTQNFRVRVRPG